MECEFCKNVFSTKTNLNNHQKRAKYCLKLRGLDTTQTEHICDSCGKSFSGAYELKRHIGICKNNDSLKKANKKIKNLEEEVIKLREKVSILQEDKKNLQDRYDNLSLTAVSGNFEDQTTIEINEDDLLSDSDFIIEETDNEEEDKQLPPLEVGKGYSIEHREEDGYINVTNLCKAGDKLFKNWKKTQKTKAFLEVLSSTVLIGTVELIKQNSGGNGERHTWVHPQVAINIAQWISPSFDVKVSGWVYEIMMTGKVDITNTTSFKKLQEENKQKSIKIQYLTKKYVKSQPRTQYKERNVVYILTTERMKKDRVYILGKANNLTNRLSTYNKSDEHEVVYYQSCGDEETMGCVENMVFQYLKEYREQANRERFILPKKEEIKLFSDTINKSVEFFKK